jgi:hypothetical protein
MAVFLRAGDEPQKWFEEQRPGPVRRFLREASEDTVISMTAAEQRRALQNLSHVRDPSTKLLLQAVITDLPRTQRKTHRFDGIFGTELPGGRTVEQILESEKFDEDTKSKARPIEVGEDSHLAFGRILEPLAQIADRVEIVDPYSVSNLRHHPSKWWLLNRLLDYSDLPITLFSNLPKPENEDKAGGPNSLTLLQECEENLRGEMLAKSYKSNFSMVMYHLDPKRFHHRRIRFVFEKSSVGYIFEKGTDAFERRIASEQHIFKAITETVFMGHFQYLNSQPVAKELTISVSDSKTT